MIVFNGTEPGVLFFFSTIAPGLLHVSVALGADKFVHAPSERDETRGNQISTQYWLRRHVGSLQIYPHK